MILLIDGYNVIKQALIKSRITNIEREQFIKQLSKYHKVSGHKIELVFDGGSYEWPAREKLFNVYLIYSGYNETADHYIKRYLKKHRALDILLVSSDRDICNCAMKLGLECIDSREFYKIMLQRLRKNGSQEFAKQRKAKRLTESENEEFDVLMQEASKVVEYKVDDFIAANQRESKAHTLSKKERKKRKKIEKL